MLRVNALTTHYGRVQAIDGVSLHVNASEIVALIGSNGAGKTTTLMTISGVLKPTRGTIELNGRALHGQAAHVVARSGIVLVPEGRRVYQHLTVAENLELGGFSRSPRERTETTVEVLEHFPRLAERRTQLGGTLSGGEQQMLAIARALMARPRVLVLDEPSLGIAPKVIDQIFDIVVALNKAGLTILLVEQNATLALEVAHRGYVLETGRVVLDGDASMLMKDPKVRNFYLGI